jgi:uncharacterized protein
MKDQLLSSIDTNAVLKASIELPYTLTTGHVVGAFIAALESEKILGSRCTKCERTAVPAQDFCVGCGGSNDEFVHLPHNGTVTAITRTPDSVLAVIQIDGADTSLVHRIVGETESVAVGSRVTASWNSEVKQNFLALDGFTLGESTVTAVEPVTIEESSQTIPYAMKLDYEHSYGPHYGRMFDELASTRRIVGSKCHACKNVLVPPRGMCELCYLPTTQTVDVSDEGRLQAFSVIHLEFVGQTRKPPYVYAEIVLDGASTRLIHNIDGIDMATAKETLSIGMKVKAVWKKPEDCIGTLDDIDHFIPVVES